MRLQPRRPHLVVIGLALAAVLNGCASDEAIRAEAERKAYEAAVLARTPPPITLADSVAESASIYIAFTRDLASIEGGFANAEAVQAALRRGASYDPGQASRGLVAYASILALQSPEFVEGVRRYASDRTVREQMVADIVGDPRYASYLPGADYAASVITAALGNEITALGNAANSIESDAYQIQERNDPRRGWATTHISDRAGRLEGVKALSQRAMLPSGPESRRLIAAAHSNGRLPGTSTRREPAYPPVVTNALALAALAALGAAGEGAQANTDRLQDEPVSRNCLAESKLNLFQCLAASRPSYEDMFCLGRHAVRDLGTCTRGAAMPIARISVSDPSQSEPPRPLIETAPLRPSTPVPPPPAAAPVPVPPSQAPVPPASITSTLNTRPGGG